MFHLTIERTCRDVLTKHLVCEPEFRFGPGERVAYEDALLQVDGGEPLPEVAGIPVYVGHGFAKILAPSYLGVTVERNEGPVSRGFYPLRAVFEVIQHGEDDDADGALLTKRGEMLEEFVTSIMERHLADELPVHLCIAEWSDQGIDEGGLLGENARTIALRVGFLVQNTRLA